MSLLISLAVVLISILFFMTFVFSVMGFVVAARQVRCQRIVSQQHLHPSILRENLHIIRSPLEDIRAWDAPSENPQDTKLPVPQTELIPGPMILPMRYQQSLLYADELSRNDDYKAPLQLPRTRAS